MEAVREHGDGLGVRVEKMDMELKAFFVEQRVFFGEALAGVENRLGARIGRVEGRLDRVEGTAGKIESGLDRVANRLDTFERNVKAGFQAEMGRNLAHINTTLRTFGPVRKRRTG